MRSLLPMVVGMTGEIVILSAAKDLILV